MKFFRTFFVAAVIFLMLFSCKKEASDRWNVNVSVPAQKVKITDISREFFDPAVSTEAFKAKYPWFQGSVSDEDLKNRRLNPQEIKVYREAAAKVNTAQVSAQLTELFARIKYYFPNFRTPQVFTFSSSTQMYQSPIIYDPAQGFLFIDISGFMGEKNPVYNGIEEYYKPAMNPQNILPKVSETIAFTLVPFDRDAQKFIDQLVYNGKVMVLQDAFLPKVADHLKMGQSQQKFNWSVTNEANIWDYFVENDLVYSPDPRLTERFIAPGPFSKFYTEVDGTSSPQVGVFTGWQICRAYLNKNPEVQLKEFLQKPASEILTKAEYKPKN